MPIEIMNDVRPGHGNRGSSPGRWHHATDDTAFAALSPLSRPHTGRMGPVPLSLPSLKPTQRRRVALVAHDNKKPGLLDWVEYNQGTLAEHDLLATGTTGKMIASRFGLRITRLLSGPLGGDQQLGARIAEGAVDVLIFFWDPLEPQPHDT